MDATVWTTRLNWLLYAKLIGTYHAEPICGYLRFKNMVSNLTPNAHKELAPVLSNCKTWHVVLHPVG
jgi:hypothetical protein